jgi:hypothetical protein
MADNLPEPKSRKESYLAKAAGMDVTVPEAPESREEQYLAAIAENGGGGGGGGGTTYTAGDGIDITDNTISVDTDTIQEKLTAGSNITISDDTISATDTTYSAFTGTDGTSAGTAGLVPAPATTDAGKFLKADGTWDTAGGGGAVKTLTTADYNYPTNTPDGIALWLLDEGQYLLDPESASIKYYYDGTSSLGVSQTVGVIVLKKPYSNRRGLIFETQGGSSQSYIIKGIDADGYNGERVLMSPTIVANLTSTSDSSALSASQGKVLKDLIDSLVIKNSGAPTTATVGTVGQLLEDTTNGKLYQCTAASGNTYTWTEVGAGGGGASGFTNGGTTAPTSATQGNVGDVYSYVDRSGSNPEPHLMVGNGDQTATTATAVLMSGVFDLSSNELVSPSSLKSYAEQELGVTVEEIYVLIQGGECTIGDSTSGTETIVPLSSLATNGLVLPQFVLDSVYTSIEIYFSGAPVTATGQMAVDGDLPVTNANTLLSFAEQKTSTTADFSQANPYILLNNYNDADGEWDMYFPDDSASPVTVTNTELGANGFTVPTGMQTGEIEIDFVQTGGYQWIDVVNSVVENRLNGLTIVSISQTDYDNLQTKDPNTLYIITGA